ncbi:hypothetical protein AB2B38_010880 [Balneola sp. MJW-20]|uniref:hypothetical protein n=1 Tax=Gracilimonas aurantiaca TaxID=3234185 RepID=UPI003465B94E
MDNSVFQFILAFLVPVILSIIITPGVIKLAHLIGAIDEPDERKVHKKLTPRLGGVAIYLSISISVLFAFFLFDSHGRDLSQYYERIMLVGAALTMVMFLGIWDDVKPLKPGVKFGVQFIIASLVYFAGVKISSVMNPLNPYVINVQFIDYPLTVIWIIGITNAINLIDGLDGLASGVSTIACVSIFSVSALTGEIGNAYIALILAGALVGFLRYNFNPAKIFLGDSGSLLLGFLLAVLSIQSSNKVSTGFSILFPILVLGLPITDTLIAMLRRFLGTFLDKTEAKSPLKRKLHKMFLPDKSHIHHQLLSRGLTHRNTVLTLYFISAFFALSAFSITMLDSTNKAIVAILLTTLILYAGIKKLRYREIDVLHNGIFLPLYERFWINKVIYKYLFDLLFISLSFTASFLIIQWVNPTNISSSNFQLALISCSVIQFLVLWAVGLYRERYKSMGLGNALKIAKYVVYASAATLPVMVLFFDYGSAFLIPFTILNFYMLLTLILGFRISYQALKYLFFRTSVGESKVLIYGANASCQMLIDQILSYDRPVYNILGIIDDNPDLEGSSFNGFSVFGGHWKLNRLFNSHNFDMILMTNCEVKPEVMKRLFSFSKKNNVPILKFNLDFHEVSDTNFTIEELLLNSEQMIYTN